MSRDDNGVETQERLLTAATEVFAEVGYRAATLREICRRGQANIAAVNYHFRDKEHLYAAVVRQAVAAAGEGLARICPTRPIRPRRNSGISSTVFWRTCWGWIARCCCCGWWHSGMMEPTPALDLVVDEGARPVHDVLDAIVAELMGPAAEAALIRDCAGSVMLQCATYQNARGGGAAAGPAWTSTTRPRSSTWPITSFGFRWAASGPWLRVQATVPGVRQGLSREQGERHDDSAVASRAFRAGRSCRRGGRRRCCSCGPGPVTKAESAGRERGPSGILDNDRRGQAVAAKPAKPGEDPQAGRREPSNATRPCG